MEGRKSQDGGQWGRRMKAFLFVGGRAVLGVRTASSVDSSRQAVLVGANLVEVAGTVTPTDSFQRLSTIDARPPRAA